MRSLGGLAILTLSSAILGAQTVETPIPFDSAQRVLAVTPSVAERLQLGPPLWSVSGAYRDARLYSVSPGGGFVLVVQRPTGTLERYLLTTAERSALGDVIDAAMNRSGRPSAELAADIVSEPAGNAFARRLTFLSALVYGPLAASLSEESAAGAGALYLATTGLTFFVSYGSAQSNQLTRAQSDLAGDLGLAAGTAGWLLGYAGTGNSERPVRVLALGSAIMGTIAGASYGKTLSDAEAHAAIFGIETVAATTLTLTTATGMDPRASAAAVALLGGFGYPLGVHYPRRASYTVTAGDVEATSTSALVGAAYAAATLGNDPSGRRIAATLGAGYLAGAFVGDQALARQFNLTQAQANLLKIGGLAGGLVGLAIPVLAGSDQVGFIMSSVAAGATLGMAGLAGTFPRAGATALQPAAPPGGSRGARLSLTPTGAFGAITGVPGRYVLARVVF